MNTTVSKFKHPLPTAFRWLLGLKATDVFRPASKHMAAFPLRYLYFSVYGQRQTF